MLATCATSLRFRSGLQERERITRSRLRSAAPSPVLSESRQGKKDLNLGVRPPWIKTNEPTRGVPSPRVTLFSLRTAASPTGCPGPRRGHSIVPRGGVLLWVCDITPQTHDPARQVANPPATLRFVRGEEREERWDVGPERWGRGVRRPVFWGLLWPPLTVEKKMAAASTCLDTPILPSEAPADPRLLRGPRVCIFHAPGGLFQPSFASHSAVTAYGLPRALPMTGTDSLSLSSAWKNSYEQRTAKGNA